MAALLAGAVERVKEVLKEDAEAATMPFVEHRCEPPLCCAVRAGCGADIIGCLLDCGAHVDDENIRGQTSLGVLSSMSHVRFDAIERSLLPRDSGTKEVGAGTRQQKSFEVAKVLLEARADPMHPDSDGRTPLDWARSAGNHHLMPLFGDDSGEDLEAGQAATDLTSGAAQSLPSWHLADWLNEHEALPLFSTVRSHLGNSFE